MRATIAGELRLKKFGIGSTVAAIKVIGTALSNNCHATKVAIGVDQSPRLIRIVPNAHPIAAPSMHNAPSGTC